MMSKLAKIASKLLDKGEVKLAKEVLASNMSYVRFENTWRDLADCANHINDDDLSKSEKDYRKRLVETCQALVEEWGDREDDEDESDESDEFPILEDESEREGSTDDPWRAKGEQIENDAQTLLDSEMDPEDVSTHLEDKYNMSHSSAWSVVERLTKKEPAVASNKLAKIAKKLLDKGEVELARELLASMGDPEAAEFLKEKQQEIADILNEIRSRLEDNSGAWNRAYRTWFAHMLGALGGEFGSEFLGGSIISMQDTIEDLGGSSESDVEEMLDDMLAIAKRSKEHGMSREEAADEYSDYEMSPIVESTIEKALDKVYGK